MALDNDEIKFLEKECEKLFYETWSEIKDGTKNLTKEQLARDMFKVGFILALEQMQDFNE